MTRCLDEVWLQDLEAALRCDAEPGRDADVLARLISEVRRLRAALLAVAADVAEDASVDPIRHMERSLDGWLKVSTRAFAQVLEALH